LLFGTQLVFLITPSQILRTAHPESQESTFTAPVFVHVSLIRSRWRAAKASRNASNPDGQSRAPAAAAAGTRKTTAVAINKRWRQIPAWIDVDAVAIELSPNKFSITRLRSASSKDQSH